MSKKKTFANVALPAVLKYARDEEFREKVATTANKVQSKISSKTHRKKKNTFSKSKITAASLLGTVLAALIYRNKTKTKV